jgi:hypothetical protein
LTTAGFARADNGTRTYDLLHGNDPLEPVGGLDACKERRMFAAVGQHPPLYDALAERLHVCNPTVAGRR